MQDVSPGDYEQLKQLLDGSLSMSVGETMGALVAVHSMPKPMGRSQWLPVVLGQRPQAEVAEPLLNALFDLYALVGSQLEQEGMLVPDADDAAAVRAFCAGYAGIIALDNSWIERRQLADFHVTLAALSDQAVLDNPGLSSADKRGWLASARRDLGDLLEAVYTKNRGHKPGAAHAVPLKIERNAPCPCGSGRKYKKCCGGA